MEISAVSGRTAITLACPFCLEFYQLPARRRTDGETLLAHLAECRGDVPDDIVATVSHASGARERWRLSVSSRAAFRITDTSR